MSSNPLATRGTLQIGDAVYSPAERILSVDGRDQRLEPRIAGLLDHLLERPGEIVRREDLLDEVWGDEGSDEALTQAVSKLRQLLGNRDLVRTEPRQGYRLTVEPVAVTGPEIAPEPEERHALLYPARALRISFGAGLVLGLLLAALAWAIFAPRPVTIFEEVTQPIDGSQPPSRRTFRCEGPPEDCEVAPPTGS